MKPASNLREIVPGLWSWSSLHEEWDILFSSAAWKGADGLVLVDPIELDAAGLAKLQQIGKPSAILLTNQNHERQADWFRKQFGIKIHIQRDAVPGIEITPDAFFCDGASLPGGLKAIHVPGATPSESVFYTEEQGGILLAGDMVMNTKDGLILLPDNYCTDAAQNRQSAKKLLNLRFNTLVVAHGDPVHPNAREQVAKLVGA